jgi:hypothetical protein
VLSKSGGVARKYWALEVSRPIEGRSLASLLLPETLPLAENFSVSLGGHFM